MQTIGGPDRIRHGRIIPWSDVPPVLRVIYIAFLLLVFGFWLYIGPVGLVIDGFQAYRISTAPPCGNVSQGDCLMKTAGTLVSVSFPHQVTVSTSQGMLQVAMEDLDTLSRPLQNGETVELVSYNGTYEYVTSTEGAPETPSNPFWRLPYEVIAGLIIPAIFGLIYLWVKFSLRRDFKKQDILYVGDEQVAQFRDSWRQRGVSSWADVEEFNRSKGIQLDRDTKKLLHAMLRRNGVIDD